jgi:HD-GYP domain-containing protein (c-di-GMP phosphodiesterase class II)
VTDGKNVAGTHPAPEQEAVQLGRSLVHSLFVLHRMVAHYPEGHPAVQPPLKDMVGAVKQVDDAGLLPVLGLQGEFLFLGGQRLKPEAGGFEAFAQLMRGMRKFGIGSIAFSPSVAERSIEALGRVLGETAPPESGDAFEQFEDLLGEKGVADIRFQRLAEEKVDKEEDEKRKERARAIYSQTLHVVSDVMDEVKLGKSLRLRKSKRIVQRMVDSLLEAETNLLGLTTIKSHDEYTYNHSVNVGILSMAIGQRIGLSRNTLADLGMASLFHDIGKSCIPLEVLNKPAEFSDQEWEIVRRHPVQGVRELLHLKGMDALSARIIMGAFEHHLGYDLTGYPDVPDFRGQSLFGRIICIADCYDAMTASRVYSRTPMAPEKVMKAMLERSGSRFDPILMKVFVNIVGIYPQGTLCRLDSGELAVVVRSSADPDIWDRPTVKVIGSAAGDRIDGDTLDLALPDTERSIAGTLDAEEYGIDVTGCFA